MSSICNKPRLLIITILLFIGSTLAISAPFSFQTPTYDRELISEINQQAILTVDNPSLSLELNYSTYYVEIISLTTNDSTVGIRAFNPQEFLSIGNVTTIKGIPLIIESDSPNWNDWNEWNVTINREDSDVDVSVSAIVYHYAQVDVAMAPTVSIALYGFPLMFIALYWLYITETKCRVHSSGDLNWEKQQGPSMIVLLVLISSFVIAPVTISVLHGNRFLTDEKTGTGNAHYSFEVTNETPIVELDLTEYTGDAPATLRLWTHNLTVLLKVGGTDSLCWEINTTINHQSQWWLYLANDISAYQVIAVEKLSENATVYVSIEDTTPVIILGYYVSFYLGITSISLVLVTWALVKAYRIDQLFRIPEKPEIDDDDDESEEENIMN